MLSEPGLRSLLQPGSRSLVGRESLTSLQRILALSPSLLIWPEQGAGWQGTSGGTLAASGQPLGLGVDLSQLGGKTLAEWLASAPELAPAVGSLSGTVENDGGASSSFSAGVWTIATPSSLGGYPRVNVSVPGITVGKVYRVTGEIALTGISAVTMRLASAGTANTFGLGVTTVFDGVVSAAVANQINIFPAGTPSGTLTFVSLSVKELPGNHLRAGTWASPSDAARASYVIQTDPALYNVSGQPELNVGSWLLSAPGTATATESPAGTFNLTGDGVNSGIADKEITTVAGRLYCVQFNIGTAVVFLRVGTAQTGSQLLTATSYGVGSQAVIFTATGTSSWLRFNRAVASLGTVSGISVKEIPASQYKYALSFDGASDYYSLLNAISITESMTVVHAIKRATTGIKSVGLGKTSASVPQSLYWQDTNNNLFSQLGSTGFGATAAANTTTGSAVVTSRRNASTDTIRLNGTQVGSAAALAAGGTLDVVGQRQGNYHAGEISFLALFPTELTGANLALVEQIAAATNGAVLA